LGGHILGSPDLKNAKLDQSLAGGGAGDGRPVCRGHLGVDAFSRSFGRFNALAASRADSRMSPDQVSHACCWAMRAARALSCPPAASMLPLY
jgi:hypothetical protein